MPYPIGVTHQMYMIGLEPIIVLQTKYPANALPHELASEEKL